MEAVDFLRGFNDEATIRPVPLVHERLVSKQVAQKSQGGAMNRRYFGVSVAAAVLLAQQVRLAVAQDAGQPSSGIDTDAAWRPRDAATGFVESLDEAARKAVSFPLEGDQRTSWSNLPVAIVPRVGIS